MKRCNVMIGPAPSARGGISTVISQYLQNGFVTALNIVYLPTFTPRSALHKLATTAGSFLHLFWLLLSGRVGVIHIHTASFNSFYRKAAFAWLGYLFGRPVLLHVHGGKFVEFVEGCSPLARRFVQTTLRRASRIIALSPYWATLLADKLRLDPQRIRVLPNPVTPAPAEPPPVARTPHGLLFLGDIIQKKGVYDLVDALALLRERGLPATLHCGGVGEIAELQAHAAARGAGAALHMLGWVDAQRKHEEFGRAALFVLPSYFEGLPMTILEAMAAGVPVLASDVGGIPDMLENGRLGWLVPAGNAAQLAVAIEDILKDAEGMQEKAKRARTAIKQIYHPHAVCKALEALYREAGAP